VKTGPRKPARISSLILVWFGLGGWAYMGGGVPGYRVGRTAGKRERQRRERKQWDRREKSKGLGRRRRLLSSHFDRFERACARGSSSRVDNLGSMVDHGERGIEMNVCVSLFLVIGLVRVTC
jgi:hypothetical protein